MTSPLGRSGWRRLFSADGDLLRRAGAKVDEAATLHRDGRVREAFAAGEQAVAMFRELMLTDRERSLPYFVTALRNQSVALQQLGRLREAVCRAICRSP